MRILSAVAMSVFTCAAPAQHSLTEGGSYDAAVPRPEEILGYRIGDRFTESEAILRYTSLLAEKSDRVELVTYGESVEGFPLSVLLISSPRHLENLPAIKKMNKRLTDSRQTSTAEARSIADTLPVLVWLSFGVHGNEASSSEAALAVAYELAASSDPEIVNTLSEAVVIVDPLVNPDGRNRYVAWYRSTQGVRPRTDVAAAEHQEPWPGGRTNHYYFDLNRDWSWSVQKETRARLPLYLEWMPHVHVDYHEMDYASTYFFFPPALPVHRGLPEQIGKWATIFGRANAQVFDKLGIRYFTGESFDLFYPGYGDSWPSFNGAVGMTYEQAGHSRAGLSVQRPDGSVLTLHQRARNHYVTALTTLRTAVRHRRERIQDFFEFWRSAVEAPENRRSILLPSERDPENAAELVRTLQRQGVEVAQTSQEVTVRAGRFPAEKTESVSFPAGTFVVRLRQPQGRLARALLETRASVQDTFFYDVSAWSLPLAFGVNAYWTESDLPSARTLTSIAGKTEGLVIGGRAAYAYIIPWERSQSAAFVLDLMSRRFTVHAADRTFQLGTNTFGRGTCVLFVQGQPDSLHDVVSRLAAAHGPDVYSTATGWTEGGPDLGSGHVRPLARPQVAILMEEPVSPSDYGELWHLFDERYNLPFTPLPLRVLSRVQLDDYNLLVLPDGSDFGRILDSAQVSRLRAWIAQGGVLVAIEGAARFLGQERSGFPEICARPGASKDTAVGKGGSAREERDLSALSFQEKEDFRRLRRIPGTILRALVDTTHPVGFGLKPELFVFKGDGAPLRISQSGHVIARFSPDTSAVSGYLPRERGTEIAGTPYAVEFALGKGRILVFAETLTFRGYWRATERLLLNAVVFLAQGRR